MEDVCIKIPSELEREIMEFNLDLSKIVAKSITEELSRFAALRIIATKGRLSERDAVVLGRQLKKGRVDKLKKEGLL